MKLLALLAALALIFPLIQTVDAAQIERTLTITLDGKDSSYTVLSYDFERTTLLKIDETLLDQVVSRFGTGSFVFYNSLSEYKIDGDSIKLEPSVTVGQKLEIILVPGEAVGGKPAEDLESYDQVEIVSVTTIPAVVNVGENFRINAKIVNNTPLPISFMGLCESPLLAEFESNVEVEHAIGCEGFSNVSVRPGESTSVSGPRSGTIYKALSAGGTEGTVRFTYRIQNELISVFAPFEFTIHEPFEGVSVAVKFAGKSTLLAVWNMDDDSVYGVRVRADTSNIDWAKARGWQGDRVDSNTILLQTDDRPVTKGRNAVILLGVGDTGSGLSWTALDKNGKEISSGAVIASSVHR